MLGSKRKFTKEQEQQICNDYFSKENPNIKILAKKWGCVKTTICNIIKRNGYKLKINGRYRIYTKEQEFEICNEYFSDKKPSSLMLAKKWNCSSQTIKDIIKRCECRLRGKGEANKGKHRSVFSKQWKRNISIANLGKKPWNKNIPCSEETKRKIRKKAITPEAIRRSLKNGFGINCYYDNEFFPSLQEKKCYIELKKLGIKIVHNFENRFDFLIDDEIVLEYHPYDLTNLTDKQYYMQRRKLLDEYGYKDLKLIVIKNLKEIKNKIFQICNFLNKVDND